MLRDSDRHRLFNRRAAILAGGKTLLLSALIGRMYYLQVIEANRYATLSDENRISLRLLPPPRGPIFDRFGTPMAINEQNYRVVMNAENIKDVEKTLEVLGSFIKISPHEQKRILREFQRKRSFVPVTIRENLNWDEVARIEVNTPDLPGITIDVGQSRYYPNAFDTAHILGYVAAVSEKDGRSDPLLELPGFRIGKSGIEKIHDLALRGSGGSSQVEVNALGRVIRELDRQEGLPGAEVSLTIDLGLQTMIRKRLEDKSAAVVVMDVEKGDVLAMVSTPSFDPNGFNKGFSVEEWKNLVSDTRAPLTNKAITGLYSPGSTFKMVVALAALEKGVINSMSEFFCKGYIKLGEDKFYCWKKGGHGTVNLKKAIRESCDVYFYEISLRTGIDQISNMAHRLGLGHALGIDLPGEQHGIMPTRRWKQDTIGSPWMQGETILSGIGQGYVLTTPLQLAVMIAQLVNGGFYVKPRLTRAIKTIFSSKDTLLEDQRSLNLNSAHLTLIRSAIEAVVNSPTGTAYKSRIQETGYEMGGKTGTVQVRRITAEEREQGVLKNSELPWEKRDHALFVGYAPINSPRYAISVVIEHGGGGSSTAAPIARDILLEAQQRNSAGQGTKQLSKPTLGEG